MDSAGWLKARHKTLAEQLGDAAFQDLVRLLGDVQEETLKKAEEAARAVARREARRT